MPNFKGVNEKKMRRFMLEGPCTTVRNLELYAHTLCMNYVTGNVFLVSSSNTTEEDTHFVLCTAKAKKQKMQLLTNGCHGNFKVDEDKALTSKCFQLNFVNFTKFGGYSLIVMSGSLQS